MPWRSVMPSRSSCAAASSVEHLRQVVKFAAHSTNWTDYAVEIVGRIPARQAARSNVGDALDPNGTSSVRSRYHACRPLQVAFFFGLWRPRARCLGIFASGPYTH